MLPEGRSCSVEVVAEGGSDKCHAGGFVRSENGVVARNGNGQALWMWRLIKHNAAGETSTVEGEITTSERNPSRSCI